MKSLLCRLFLAALGIYLALGMGRAAAAIRSEQRRAEDLQRALSRLGEQSVPDSEPSETALRLWAFRTRGMTAAEDVVFFDAGGKNQGGANLNGACSWRDSGR